MHSGNPYVLSVRDLIKVYPRKPYFVAVDGISFDLAEGEILGLLGPNGAGKTTTIQMLLSTLKPTSGSIFYFGKDFSKHRSEILKNVVFASTYVSLPWMLTVKQNLEVFGRLYGIPRSELTRRMDELLKRFGIYEKKQAAVAELSAGQITRLMLVKAFMVQPKIVLLDEPTASLDPDIAQDVCQFVLEQRDRYGISILYTSHNMAEVAEVCDRALFLRGGKIIANGVPDELARSVSTSRVQLVVGDGMKRTMAIAERLNMPYRVEHRTIELQLDENQIAALLTALAQAGVFYSNINILQPTLEEYFLRMVEEGRPHEEGR
jgi:ABC-2 type transport system ATP-binding protein